MSSCCAERGPSGQRGVALITVLLVFALATLMASQMLRTSYLAIQRTGNLVDSTQARYYAYGAEDLARQVLREDARAAGGAAGKGIDHLGEAWAAPNLQFEIEDGRIELAIEDLGGRFNLNGLVDAKGKADPIAVERLARLLRSVDLDPALAQAVADWVDADDSTPRGGGEGPAWGLPALPNQPFADATELRALPGVDAEAWQRLGPLVAAVPRAARLNINTAPPEVLLAYAEKARPADVERFVLVRRQQPIRDAADPALAQLFGSALTALDVRSRYFSARIHAEYRGRHARFETRLQRDPRTGEVGVMARSDAARI